MKRMMKKPQALHPDAPLLNLGHGKPISRRDMLGRGLVSGAAFGSVGLFGLFSNPREAMAALQGDLETIKTDCGILGAGAGKIPFICFDLAGGANIAGSNVLVGGQGGQLDFLSSAGYSKLGLPGGKKTKTGAWVTDADVLEGLAAEGHALPRTIVDWRTLSKLRSTYTEALQAAINKKTGRVHTSYAMAVAQTGRLSSSDPNLQNIPVRTEEGRKIRQAFIADEGNVLVSADYSQIELRILAHMADIPALKEAFLNGLDIHAMTASEMFGVPIEGMDPMVRRQAKAINFGIIYGISGFGLARQLGIPQGEAAEYIKTYFKRFPGIRAYMDETKDFAKGTGYVKTAFGRKIHLEAIKSKGPAKAFAERQAINAPIQGSAADVIKRAMIRMPDALAKAGLTARMLLQVHDELVFECPENEAETLIKVAQDTMQGAALPALNLSVPLVVDARAAKNWAEAH